MFPRFQVSISAKKLGFQIRRVKRAGCMFSAANQTPTASVEIPLRSVIGLNDGSLRARFFIHNSGIRMVGTEC